MGSEIVIEGSGRVDPVGILSEEEEIELEKEDCRAPLNYAIGSCLLEGGDRDLGVPNREKVEAESGSRETHGIAYHQAEASCSSHRGLRIVVRVGKEEDSV